MQNAEWYKRKRFRISSAVEYADVYLSCMQMSKFFFFFFDIIYSPLGCGKIIFKHLQKKKKKKK